MHRETSKHKFGVVSKRNNKQSPQVDNYHKFYFSTHIMSNYHYVEEYPINHESEEEDSILDMELDTPAAQPDLFMK